MAATGVYGIGVPANITSQDVDIFYCYHEERSSDSTDNTLFQKLPSSIIVGARIQASDSVVENDVSLPGMYNLKLPTAYFNRKGFYSIYIRPKEISCRITDVGVLASYPDVRGIVLNSDTISDASIRTLIQENNGLVGYRVEYFTNGERLNYYRIVTSSNKAEPVVQNLSNSNQKSVRYRYNDSANLVFLTLTPSTAPTFKPNAFPFIGNPNQQILLINTKFNPIMIDLEITEHDIETLTTMIEGDQLRNLDAGMLTTFTENGEIYKQQDFYSLKSTQTANPIYEVKKNRSSIDFTQDYSILQENQ